MENYQELIKMKGYFLREHVFFVERKQSKWRVTLCTTTCCSAPQCGEQSLCWYLGIRPGDQPPQMLKAGFSGGSWVWGHAKDSSSLCHPNSYYSATRWCSRFLCVARPRCTGLPNALASRRSRKWFGIQQCELLFGNGERVQCLLQIQVPYWREDGAFEGDRVVPRHVAVTVCSSTTSRSGSHICCERGMRTFPPHSRSPSVWWWVLVKN